MPITRTTSACWSRGRRFGAGPPGACEAWSSAFSRPGPACPHAAAERAVSGAARARDRDDDRGQVEQPGERDLGRRHAEPARSRPSARRRASALHAARPAERRVGDHRDSELVRSARRCRRGARGRRGDRARHLDRADRDEVERLLELRPVDVRESGVADSRWSSRRASARTGGSPRRPRVGRVDQVQVDRQAAERGEARLAVARERLGTAVGHPAAGGRVIPPLVTIRRTGTAPQARSAEASRRSLWPSSPSPCRRPRGVDTLTPAAARPRWSHRRAPRHGRVGRHAHAAGPMRTPRREAIQGHPSQAYPP